MAELNASVVLNLVDRISRPVRRIEQRFSRLGRSQGLQQLRRSVANVGQQWGNVTSQAGRLTRRLTVIGGTAAGAAWGFERLVGGVTESADATVKAADRLGVPIERLQEWRYGAERSGLAANTFDMALQRFTRRTAEAASGTGEAVGALKFLGIQLRDANGNLRPTTELLPEVADALAGVEDPAMRVRAAFKLFDSEGVAMLNFLEGGSQGLRDLAQEAHNAGVVMDEAFARQAVEYNDTMMDFRRTLLGVRMAVVRDILPALTEWLQRVKDLTQGNREMITRRIIDGLRQFWAGLLDVGRVLAWTADLLGGWGKLALLIGAIMAGPLLLALAQFVFAFGKLGTTLTVLAVKAMPAVIGAVRALGVALLSTPVGWILAAIAAIAGAAYLIYRNWEPIKAFVFDLWAEITDIFGRALAWITETLSPTALATAGRDWIGGMLDGAIEKLVALRNAVEQRIQGIVDWIKERLSPSAWMEVGREWIDGLREGIAERFTALSLWLERKVAGLIDWMPDWAKEGLGLEGMQPMPAMGANALDDQAVDSAMAVAGETRVGGELRITIDSEGRPRVDEMRRDGPMEFDVDTMPSFGGAMP
ncbi:phage tail tape measure protein [Billgrantia gudaonensis]|uniref:Phage tail tape measure protein, TP901 family, core region n=1 Tax=Billgrantia gudaonensis TaxID=376427 RepID=A0A1G9AY58_9GAMM|nr:phage tail tape measure protein [Halomonas gudaonensis]SDK32177.1 phage tail tape measure protein, TP901 family, core region [Halomonas gudaonensis]